MASSRKVTPGFTTETSLLTAVSKTWKITLFETVLAEISIWTIINCKISMNSAKKNVMTKIDMHLVICLIFSMQ